MPFALLFQSAPAVSRITALDWTMIALYFGILLCVAWWVVRNSKENTTDYFLAGRNLGWWVIGASIFASNIGSEHIVGLAGSGATSGVAMAHYELHAWCLLVLAWVFVPFYMRSMVFTMPEFLERRFNEKSRYVLSIVSLITFVISKIAVGIFAGGVVFGTLLPEMQLHIGGVTIDSFWIGSVLVIVLTGLYTTLGGMRAVAYNDAVQVVVLITGSFLLTAYGLMKLGGWHELRVLCGSDMFNLWKPLIPAGVAGTWSPVLQTDTAGKVLREAWYFNDNFPWLGMLFCAPIIGLWYWCTDQYIVQRALGAPNQKVARQGSIFAAFLKLFPVYLFIIPGLICYALAKSGKIPELSAMIDANGQVNATISNGAFPMMVQYLLPPGLRGIVVAGLLSALMGSLAGVFNACSTLFTVDLYQKWNTTASQAKLVKIGRTATVVMIVIALAWIPVIKGAHGLYTYLQAVQGYLAPPIFVVFFLGVFWKRMNGAGALWAMIVGFALGIFRMLVDTPVTLGLAGYEKGYPAGTFLWIVNNIYFQYFSVLITLVSALVMVGVSLMTAEPDYESIQSLTFGTTTHEDRKESRLSWGTQEVLASALVLVCIAGGYLYFRG
ncbi:MAG TPA: sodium:solute symporter [Candidatus Sulfopaludibacter sp.]|jgi:SSS family solute:Na+ symporter|nr:sodium:solute symporter [Candidatus Sulfopaludibacter sp.]